MCLYVSGGTCVCMCLYVSGGTKSCVCTPRHICIHVYVCMHTCVCIHVCAHMCMHTCVCTHVYARMHQRNTHTYMCPHQHPLQKKKDPYDAKKKTPDGARGQRQVRWEHSKKKKNPPHYSLYYTQSRPHYSLYYTKTPTHKSHYSLYSTPYTQTQKHQHIITLFTLLHPTHKHKNTNT